LIERKGLSLAAKELPKAEAAEGAKAKEKAGEVELEIS